MYFEILKYQPHGMVQPAVLFVNTDMTVLAKWVQISTVVSSVFLSFYLNVLFDCVAFCCDAGEYSKCQRLQAIFRNIGQSQG